MSRIKELFYIVFILLCLFAFSGCSQQTNHLPDTPLQIDGLTFEERVESAYAEQFIIDRYNNGYSVIFTADGAKYLLCPASDPIPGGMDNDISIIYTPADNVYMAATSVMGLFDELNSGCAVKFSGTTAENWHIEYAKNALNKGNMLYAGKYSEPDYELLLTKGCSLAIESTMIEHTPDVKEKLQELGITVFVDYSSYESHPLGRCEWIKVYGEMLGKSKQAEQLFEEQAAKLEKLNTLTSTNKTAAFFYIGSAGQAVTRKPGDYITKMIELAGGKNVFDNISKGGFSSVTLEWEEFYTTAKDADFIIYNSTIDGELRTIDDLTAKNELLKDFKAVKNNNVWCLSNNLYQETMKTGSVIADFNSVFTGNTDNYPPVFLYKLESGDSNNKK